MGIKVKPENIAWMEEFGTLDQPIASQGANVITLRSLMWMAIGAILIYKGMMLHGPKIHGIVPIEGLVLIIPGALFLMFGLIPSKSVRREIQFLFAIQLLIKRITQGNPNAKKKKVKTVKPKKKPKKKKKKNKKKGRKQTEKATMPKKRKVKPLRLS